MSLPKPLAGGALLLRELNTEDYERGYLDLLAQLTTVGAVTREQFCEQLERMRVSGSTVVVAVTSNGDEERVVGSCTMLVEAKFIHACSCVGHIEDVVVCQSQRGKGLGLELVRAAVELAKTSGCYKVILDCAESNVGFYEKIGFKKKECQMRLDIA